MLRFLVSLFLLFGFLLYGIQSQSDSIFLRLTRDYWETNTLEIKKHLKNFIFECTTDEECQDFIEDSVCVKTKCECPAEKLLSSDGSQCLDPAKEFGSQCKENIQCSRVLSSGGTCKEGVCKCKSGYHYLKGFCWKSFGLHEKCQRTEQCFSDYEYIGFECKNKTCGCRPNYYQRLDSGCRRKRKIGESCNLDIDCEDQTSCERRKCTKVAYSYALEVSVENENATLESSATCLKGMFLMNGQCVRELGTDCQGEDDCNHIKNAICLDNVMCACKPSLYVAGENNKICLQVTPGKVEEISKSSCKENAQCGVFGNNAFCKSGKCACKNGTYWENNQKYCWSIKGLGEACSHDTDCHPDVAHAECEKKTSICVCQKGFHLKDQKCLQDATNLGDQCEANEDCLFPNSACDKETNTCICKDNHYVENKKCIPGVQSFCSNPTDCSHLRNTECTKGNFTNKQCLCLKNYVSSKDKRYCLPGARYGENCTESFQCKYYSGELAKCWNGICGCNETTHFAFDRCYKTRFVGNSCTKKAECFPGNDTNSIICLKGFCACNFDYTLNDYKFCVKANLATSTKFYSILLIPLLLLTIKMGE